MNRDKYFIIFSLLAIVLCSCAGYDGKLVSLKDCPQEVEGVSVELQKEKHPIFTEFVDNVIIIYDGSTSKCHLDARWVKNDWEGDVNHGFGKYYFVDANYDGYLDVFLGGGDSYRSYLALWNPKKEVYEIADHTSDLRCSLFSPSEDAIYKLHRYEKELLYCSYLKSEWIDGELCPIESLSEVWTEEGGEIGKVSKLENTEMTHKYTIFGYDPQTKSRTEIIGEYDDVYSLPNNWKDVIVKMKNDYPIDRMLKDKPERTEIVMKSVEYNSKLLSNYRIKADDAWIDMGVVADDSTQLLWAESDLILRGDNTIGISDYATPGSSFGWGDASGRADESSSEYRFYGGENPPRSIAGNPKYDIVSAYFGNTTRLPTKTEWIRLLENCERNFTTIYRELPSIGEDGLPSWVQGQWMTQMKIGNSILSTSIKIDGIGGSITVVQGGSVTSLYDGTFDYDSSSGLLSMGDFRFHVQVNKNIITTDTGLILQKISNDTDSRKVYGLMLTSKINGEKLFFPVDTETDYWSATVAEEDAKDAYVLYVKASNPVNVAIGYEERNRTKRIRPVSSDAVNVTVGFAKK